MKSSLDENKPQLDEKELAIQQAKRYAEDFSVLYESEKEKRRLLEKSNAELLAKTAALEAEISERKRAEEKIREQARLIDIANEAILVCDLDDRIVFWNKGAERVYGWQADEAIGKILLEIIPHSELSKHSEAKKKSSEKGEWQGEFNQTDRADRSLCVDSHWTLMLDEEGKSKSIMIINSDITEKKEIENRFLRTQRMESIGTLAGGIAHDLNNILSPILMAGSLLQSSLKDERSQDLISRIVDNADRAAAMVKQILTFARGIEGERSILQPRHLIKEMVKISKDTFPKSLEITSRVPSDLWVISGDATQIQQVLMNLCVNARDAMPRGGSLTIETENATLSEDFARMYSNAKSGPYVLISVSDTGTGIPAEDLEKIFEAFYTTKEVGKGTGLGLATVETIVRSHGGFIDVDSEVGKGTRFKVYLPASIAEDELEMETDTGLPVGSGETILFVDDEASIREIASETLGTYGYNVLTADDGAEAVALFAQNKDKIGAVLIDIMMPIMDGPAAIKALKKLDPEVKVIAASGRFSGKLPTEATQLGAREFLQKPFTAETLIKTVYKVLHE